MEASKHSSSPRNGLLPAAPGSAVLPLLTPMFPALRLRATTLPLLLGLAAPAPAADPASALPPGPEVVDPAPTAAADPTVEFVTASQTGGEADGTLTATLTLSATHTLDVTVPFTLSGTATDVDDYSAAPNPLVIQAGNLTADITLTLVDDALDEDPETVVLTLGTPTNATLGASTVHTATLTDDDPLPSVEFSLASQSSAEAGAAVSVEVALSAVSGRDVSVPFTVAGSASDPDDYTIDASPLVITAGASSASITVTPLDDGLDEADETVEITLGTPTNATLGVTVLHTLSLLDDDPTPSVAFSQSSQVVSESAPSATVTAVLSAVSGRDVTVPFTVGGSASDPDDYTIDASPLVIPAGQPSAAVQIHPVDDLLDEPAEDVVLTMGTPTNAILGGITVHTATLSDDDPPPTVEFALASQTTGEGTLSVLVVVDLSGPSGNDVTVPFTLSGSASDPDDYTVDASPLVIAAGALTADIEVLPVDDALHEADETVVLTLGPPIDADLGAVTEHTLTLGDDDAPPVVEFLLASQTLPEGSGLVPVTVTLSAASGLDVNVPFTVGGTALMPDDYTIDASPLVITAGATSKDIVVDLVDDILHEPPETVEITLGTPTDATLGGTTLHVLTIANDDPLPTVEFAVASSAAGEGTGSTLVTLTLSGIASTDVFVPLSLSGSASEGDDYDLASNPAVIPQGLLTADLVVNLLADSLDEADETAVLTMDPPTGADLGSTVVHTLTIGDDDPPPVVQFVSPRQFQGESAGVIPVEVSLSTASGLAVTVPYALKGNATVDVDYTIPPSPLVINPGATLGVIAVDIIDDIEDEPTEFVLLRIDPSVVNGTLGSQVRHRVNIKDNDGLGFEDDVGGLRPDVILHGFTQTRVGEFDGPFTVTLTNIDDAPVAFQGIRVEGDADGDFLVSYPGSLPVLLDPGASTTFDVTYSPLQNGRRTAVARAIQNPTTGHPGRVRLTALALGPTGAEVALNAANQPFVDGLGQYWAADWGHQGSSAHVSTSADILGTLDDPLYQTARVGTAFGYSFTLPNGEYDVVLHAAEIEPAGAGQRVFDVLLEGTTVLDDLDLFVSAGANAAFISAPYRVTVADGELNVDLAASAGEGLLAGLEVRSVPVLELDTTLLDFGAVEQGFTVEQVLTVTNNGLHAGHADQLGFILDGTSQGTGTDFYVRIGSTDHYGGVSSVFHSIDLSFPAGQATPISVFFEPTEHATNRLKLQFDGDSPTLAVELRGTGGGDPGWGFLHPVLDTDRSLIVDHDGDMSEDVWLRGDESHTHEPGQLIALYEWRVDGQLVASTPNTVQQLALGSFQAELTITDDKLTPDSASDDMTVTVWPADGVPGTLAMYYDGSLGGAQSLLDSLPAKAQYIEHLALLTIVANEGLVGNSPFSAEVMVRLQAEFQVAQSATYDFLLGGGTETRLEVDGAPWTGPGSLGPGQHSLEVRFAVVDLADLPLTVTVTIDGVPQPAFADSLVHDENGIVPTIHSMPSVGTELGGNLITIRGFGYYPLQDVKVLWGTLATFTQADFVTWRDDQIEVISPPGTGTINVVIETPAGQSDPKTFTYSPDGPVPIVFERLDDRTVPMFQPTTAVLHPNGRLYVGRVDGHVAEMEFDENWFLKPPGVTVHDGVSGLTNSDLTGIAVSPYDDPAGPVVLYVSHGEHWLNGGGSFTGPSPYTGQVSVLTGPTFDNPVALISQLPTSNHDHSINGLLFDNNGDLLVCVGGNTNAGVKWPLIGDLVESPFSASIVKAETSRSDFNGAIIYLDRATGNPVDDQVFGEDVDVAPGVHVSVYASGLRNPYDLLLATWGYLYASDNGPNTNYGFASMGPDTDSGSHADDSDEIDLVELGSYYGHPNRGRGFHDPRQYVYRTEFEPSDGTFTQRIWDVDSSTNGMAEYRSDCFNGQIRGRLLAQKWSDRQYLLQLSADRRSVVDEITLSPLAWGLDVLLGYGGAILAFDYTNNQIQILQPVDVAAVGLTVYEITPWRAPQTGGTPFVIGGEGFVSGQTSVTIAGAPATVTQVTPRRIHGVLPPLPPNNVDTLYDVEVLVAADSVTFDKGFLSLPAQPGLMPGFWTTGASLPDPLGEVACAVVGTTMYVFGEGTSKTYAYDLLGDTWKDDLATRPFPGNHHACEVVGGNVYLFGGLGSSSPGEVQIYDPATDTWSSGAPMPWAGGSCSSALVNGKVYVCGGIVGSSTVNNLSVYDPALDTWDDGGALNLAPMPVGVNHAASASDGAQLWVFGGRQGGNFPQPGFDTVQVYDPATDVWDSSSQAQSQLTPMPSGRGGTGRAVLFAGEFYVFGGEEPGNVFDEVFVYRPSTNGWREDAPMPTARHGIFPVRFQGRIFLPAGGTSAGFSSSDLLEIFQRP